MPSSAGVAECSGIVSIWHSSPAEAAAFTADAECVHPGRFLLGLGTSHAVLVEGKGTHYRRPYSTMVEYINALDAAGLAPERRILAALGPRMLQLSRDRSAGAHPYFTTAALIPWGTVEQVAAGIEKHYRVGADEVAIQVLNGGDATMFRDGAGLIRSRPYRFDGRARKAPSAVAYPKNST